jgi:hypothetical protein
MGSDISTLPVKEIAKFTSLEDYGSVMSLNKTVSKDIGLLAIWTKTSVMNNAEINNMITLYPLLLTLSIEIDHPNTSEIDKRTEIEAQRDNMETDSDNTETESDDMETTKSGGTELARKEDNRDVYFPHLRYVILSSAPGTHRGLVDLRWLAHKMPNMIVNNLNILHISPSDVDTVYAFMNELMGIKTLAVKWETLEDLFAHHGKADVSTMLHTVDGLHVAVSWFHKNHTFKTRTTFEWLQAWAKSTTHGRDLFITIENYNDFIRLFLTTHNANQPSQHGLQSFHLKINNINDIFMVSDIDMDDFDGDDRAIRHYSIRLRNQRQRSTGVGGASL